MAAPGLSAKRSSNVQPVIREIGVVEYSEASLPGEETVSRAGYTVFGCMVPHKQQGTALFLGGSNEVRHGVDEPARRLWQGK